MSDPIIVQYAMTPNRHNVPILVNWDNEFISAKLRRIGDNCWYDGHYYRFGQSLQHFQVEAKGLKIYKRHELMVNGTKQIFWAEDVAQAHLFAKQKFGFNAQIHDVFPKVRVC